MCSRFRSPSSSAGAGLHVLALRQGASQSSSVQCADARSADRCGSCPASVTPTVAWRCRAATGHGSSCADAGVPVEALRNDEIPRVAALSATILVSLALTRTRSGRGRCLRLAAGSGIASGVASVLAQTQLLRFGGAPSGGAVTLAVAGTAVLIAAFAVSGLLLAQTAYRCGLGAPLATLTIVNPIAAAAIGFILLGQGSAMGATRPVTIAAAAGSVVLLAPASAAELVDHGTAGTPPGDSHPQRLWPCRRGTRRSRSGRVRRRGPARDCFSSAGRQFLLAAVAPRRSMLERLGDGGRATG
jgi:hypothetical protein